MLRSIFFCLLLLQPVWLWAQLNDMQDSLQNALRQYRYNEALMLLETVPLTRENRLQQAQCYEKLYNYTSALPIYKQLTEEYPDETNLMIATAECASQAGDSRMSLQYWIAADSLSPGNQFIQTRKAMAFYKNNNWTETIAQSKTVFETDSVPMLLRMVGDSFLYSNQADSAILYYYKTIEKNPMDYLAVNKLGNIYLAAKFYTATIDLTQAYLDSINPNQPMVGQLNGMAHYSEGNYQEATQRLKDNVELGDSSYTTCYYLGMSLYARKLFYEATTWLEKAYNQNDTDVNLLYYFGTSLSRTYDRKRGIEVLAEGVEKIDKIYAMMFDFDQSFADAYVRSKNYTKAIEYFQSAYKRNPDYYPMLNNIGNCYELMKDYKNAITYYERFLKTEPQAIAKATEIVEITEETEIDELLKEIVLRKKREIENMKAAYRVAEKRIEKLKEELFFE